MPAVRKATRELIRVFVDSYLYYTIETLDKNRSDQVTVDLKSNPFLYALLPDVPESAEVLSGFRYSTLGLDECARLIALDHHQAAVRSYATTGLVSRAAKSEIERQVSYFEAVAEQGNHAAKPTLEAMIEAVLGARRDDDLDERTIRADLYVLDKDGTEFFFEMKSPNPNKGQCLEVTQRILRIHLLRGKPRPAVNGYFAMAYNPDGPTRENYQWSISRTYMPFEQAVIIGEEFWNIIGGPTTFVELLEIYQEVGRNKAKYILDSLAYGF